MGDRFDDSLTKPLEGAAEAAAAEGATSPAVGRDEWVARHGEHQVARGGIAGAIESRLRTVPWWAWLALFVALFCLLPVGVESGYWRRVAFDTVIYMLLALGLNVVVGWGGLLDLGYVAFFGVGAYTYAFLSSDKFDIHVSPPVTIAIVGVVGAAVGFIVGLPSRRLSGDYLAIVTLFFFQSFLVLTNNGDNVFGHDLTGGPNGILAIDPLGVFGHELPVSHEGIFNIDYLYVALVIFAITYAALHLLNDSRTGRAWRSLREDPLAAELMGMPVNRLKLMAFSYGAAVAAISGTIVSAVNASVFPQNFEFQLLIAVYTMVILGGAGNQAGVVLGAMMISVLLELLREPDDSRYVFYVMIVLGLVAVFRLSTRLAIVVAGTAAFGFATHALAKAIDPSWVDGLASGAGNRLADAVGHWVIVPSNLAPWVSPVSYVTLVALVLCLTVLRGWARIALLVPTLYLAAFVWENIMLSKPEPTRFIVLGAILVATMIARPVGILGERRVEIV